MTAAFHHGNPAPRFGVLYGSLDFLSLMAGPRQKTLPPCLQMSTTAGFRPFPPVLVDTATLQQLESLVQLATTRRERRHQTTRKHQRSSYVPGCAALALELVAPSFLVVDGSHFPAVMKAAGLLPPLAESLGKPPEPKGLVVHDLRRFHWGLDPQ